MNLSTGLWQRQELKLKMTQELSQAIALLQYSSQELTSFLEEKALENPLMQIEHANIHMVDPRRDRIKKKNKKAEKDKQSWIEQIGAEHKSLHDYLFGQIHPKSFTDKQLNIIREIILNIDENGYLCTGLEEICGRLNISVEEGEYFLKAIQELEPAGVGARSLKECLLLQVKRLDEPNELAEKILMDHFTLFAEKKWKQLAKELNVTLREIQAVFDLVQTLNPRPLSQYQQDQAVYIVPDVEITWDGETFTVRVLDEILPKISFNDDYYKQFSAYKDQQVKSFLKEKQQDYHWIMKSLEQRRETLAKVTLKIVEKQADFFLKGPSYLKPMTMKEISEEIGIHESTVSRAVREKYAQTPFGTFELKSFFSSTLQTTSSENASSEQVKNLIAGLVEKEDKRKPLSDQAIAKYLKEEEGIVVSRRTVAKYRDQLGIPSSMKRKRYD